MLQKQFCSATLLLMLGNECLFLFCCLFFLFEGCFIRKILQPALDTVQRRRSGGQGSGDMGIPDVTQGTTTDPHLSLDHTQEVGGELPGAPIPKRQRHVEDDLMFLLVKDKEGVDQLFVDLGRLH